VFAWRNDGSDPWSYCVTATADSGLNANSIAKVINEAAEGRGGGKPDLVQGSIKRPDRLDEALARAGEELEKHFQSMKD